MKPFAVTLLIVIVSFTFIGPVSAECFDWASCKGDKAEIDARMEPWAKETAVAVRVATAEARQAMATQRAYDRAVQLTATEAARPTRTPVPTVTAQPSATVQATSTPQPTQTTIVLTVQVVITEIPQPQAVTTVPAAPWWVRVVATIVGLPVLLVAMFWILGRFRRVI